MSGLLSSYASYLKEHYLQGTFGSMGAFTLSYINVDVKEAYEILLELLRFIILLFGAITAILTFYVKFVKKDKEENG